WIGIDDGERAILAMAAMANTGRSTVPPEYLRLASAAELRDAITWGLAIRLCRRFSGCIAQTLSGSTLQRQGGKLVFSIEEALQPLYTETVEKDLRLLAAWLELEPVAKPASEATAAE